MRVTKTTKVFVERWFVKGGPNHYTYHRHVLLYAPKRRSSQRLHDQLPKVLKALGFNEDKQLSTREYTAYSSGHHKVLVANCGYHHYQPVLWYEAVDKF